MLLSAIAFPARGAAAEEPTSSRTLTLQVGGGLRIFNSQLGLTDELSQGARLGVGVTERVTIGLDYIFSAPARESSSAAATVHALRALVRFDLLAAKTRPYLIAGIGGAYFDFGDASDNAVGALTIGCGIATRLGERYTISVEATGDFYRSRVERFNVTGDRIGYGPLTYQGMGTVGAHVGLVF